MKYLCLVYATEADLRSVSEAEKQALIDASLDYDEALRQSGHFLAAQVLQPPSAARTLRVRKNKLAVTDGPFAETKEQLLGFLMIEAAGDAEALDIAAKMPVARYASVELRPIRELTHSTGNRRR